MTEYIHPLTCVVCQLSCHSYHALRKEGKKMVCLHHLLMVGQQEVEFQTKT